MKLILIIAGSYPSCKVSIEIWNTACQNHNIELNILDLENKTGKILTERLNIKSFPALIENNKIIAVGRPDTKTAEKIIKNLID